MRISRLTTPILARLLQHQRLCQFITGVAGLHLTLLYFKLPSWPCPLRHGLGIPCPSCGLSRALAALLTGQWERAIALHAFAPLVAVLLGLIAYGGMAPERYRRPLIQWVGAAEQRLGLSAGLLSLFCLYWLVRLVWFREALYQLVVSA